MNCALLIHFSDVGDVIKRMAYLFEADYLLPRTIMASLKFKQLESAISTQLIPPDVSLATIHFHVKSLSDDKKEIEKYKMVQRCLVLVSQQIKAGTNVDSGNKWILEDLYRTFKIGFDLLDLSEKKFSDNLQIPIEVIVTELHAFATYEEHYESQIKRNPTTKGQTYQKIHVGFECYEGFRQLALKMLGKSSDLTLWNRVLSVELQNGEVKSTFKSTIRSQLDELFLKKGFPKIVKLYCEESHKYGSDVQDILSKLAFEAMRRGERINDIHSYEEQQQKAYGQLMSKVFEEYWANISDEKLFDTAVSWSPFVHFVEMFYNERTASVLSEECSLQLAKAVTKVQDINKELETGHVTVKDLNIITEENDMFKRVVTVLLDKEKKIHSESYFEQLMSIRQKELEAYKYTLKLVTDFVSLGDRLNADMDQLLKQLESLRDLDNQSMSLLCKPAEYTQIKDIKDYKPEVVAFGLNEKVLNILPEMSKHNESVTFIKKWKSKGNAVTEQSQKKLSIEETITLIWEPVQKEWHDECTQISKGNISFQKFEELFKESSLTELRQEFTLMAGGLTAAWIDTRLEQIRQYREIQGCVRGAEAILDVMKCYELKGNFEDVQKIKDAMTDNNCMISKNPEKSMMKSCKILTSMTKEQCDCLKVFNDSKPLVLWLRKSMPSGLKELKVFVDLAYISAGEGDMEIAKVQCLHAATTGYAPLIFNFNSEIDYDGFVEKCKMVWKELKNDKELSSKLRDTNRQLNWLKSVKQAHGSVEVTSLTQAEAINSVGIYEIGKIHKSQGNKLLIDDVLSLVVAEDDQGKRLRKCYNYGQLHDLQSRLMLVAGKAEKGKDDVDRFTMILDSVIRLSKVYIRLVSSGCVLFLYWKTRLLCDRTRKACCFITFGEGNDTKQLKGRTKDDRDEVSSIVPRLAKFMEQCLQEWLQYINDKRDRYYYLNFFTIDQMVILQRELVKIGTANKPSDFIFPLLSLVKKNCTLADIVASMEEAKNDLENMNEDNGPSIDGPLNDEVHNESQKREQFIEALINVGYKKSLARKALNHFKPDNHNLCDAITWCLEQPENVIETSHGQDGANKSISAVTADILDNLQQATEEVSVNPLIEGLESLWKKFLNSISSSVSDYLSVEHLGLILERLSQKETIVVQRNLLQCFKSGVPNLIMCPQADILNTVLTIYLRDDTQPLPQPDEVLICSSKTTLDQLDIFWKRALFKPSGKIHCLVNGDLLDYEVSDKGDQYLERHMAKAKDKNFSYRLLVLCQSENEYKSRLVSALDRFRRPSLTVADQMTIKSYLQKQLRFNAVNGDTTTAARVDFDQSTVRVVKSWRAGVGKTLYKNRIAVQLNQLYSSKERISTAVISIPLYEREINVDALMERLLEHTLPPELTEPRVLHIDVSHEVCVGVDEILFQLLILGCLSNSSGYVWRKLPHDHYLIETTPQLSSINQKYQQLLGMHRCFDVLPDITCRSPEESLNILKKRQQDIQDNNAHDLLFDQKEFESSMFQRPYQYLKNLDGYGSIVGIYTRQVRGDHIDCLQVLLRHCGLRNPSWAELKHFVWFLDTQLQDFEVSAFCGQYALQDLPGFAKFVLKFLLQMSRDFATRSLNMSEESPDQQQTLKDLEGDQLIKYQLKKTWESSPHPYIFFNPDRHSMTFLGFNINASTGDLVDHQTGKILESAIMAKNLQDSLRRNKVDMNENFDNLPRESKLQKLCTVMGINKPFDPDSTYELTTDNVKKILAIYMRFKCDIPVIVMGETGCGKTRLVKFMCSLQCPQEKNVQNMILMKVHGGTKCSDIIKKVEVAENIAKENTRKYGDNLQTVLFFDEANTTEAIGLIKEIICDKTLAGKPLDFCRNLKMIAACNPYRKHSEDLIKRLEQAGLGYHVEAEKTAEKLGHVPLRRLVYRVQPLPRSLLPFVWDFGQLDTRVEELYIRQMVVRYINDKRLPRQQNLENVLSRILTVSQDFLRNLKDECSFVSLRDVERVMEVMSWFYAQTQGASRLFNLIDKNNTKASFANQSLTDTTRSLVLALGVCYHACLKKREQYRDTVAQHFRYPCPLPGGAQRMLREIESCQDVFLENVQLGNNIAKNQALKENVFMMVTCIELRIPLFLVGKPGSSKSLAKTIVSDAMQGHASHKPLYREYKTVQMASFQCSPLSIPEGIIGTFRQCANYQKDRDLNTFVSVVVLDEIGLAEDSPRMPLKTLHPLLEDGCDGCDVDEISEQYKKVGFIGISNWSLDPAKMNRGILVQREVPELKELEHSAEGICSSDKNALELIRPFVKNMAESYLYLFNNASLNLREFFGLRDFYSLLKMVFAFANKSKKKPTWVQLQHAILRNFGGMEGISPVDIFFKNMKTIDITKKPAKTDPLCTPVDLIKACLEGNSYDSDSRYLLLLTENYGALNILQQKVGTIDEAKLIFGSSFPSDQEYTQICRNINRIKVCMETGNTVILLNLENLYESLYDALNQYYVEFGGERYVDLGLGSHRVKCRVHRNFRLIVVAEKTTVYERFPIPLINRLEKHFLNISTMLTPEQEQLAKKLNIWVQSFVKIESGIANRFSRPCKQNGFSINEVFMGFNEDTCAAIVFDVISKTKEDEEEKILENAKRMLLWCATPDSLMRLSTTSLWSAEDFVSTVYFEEQHHDCLSGYLKNRLRNREPGQKVLAQITTHSKLITTANLTELSVVLEIPVNRIKLLHLQSIDTEQQFCRQIRNCYDITKEGEDILLIVQSDSGDQNTSLVACSRYCIQDEIERHGNINLHVALIIQLPRFAGGSFNGFQCGIWHSLHMDDLHPVYTLTVPEMKGQSISALIHQAVTILCREQMKGDCNEGQTDDTDVFRGHKLPVYKIIMSCVQAALAMVKDIKVDKSRETERVAILLRLLSHEDQTSATQLILGLSKHLDLLLQEKEKHFANVDNWLRSEASKAENINKAGTFRRSWMMCMEGKVTPLLAGIIAFIDTNRNLDCLQGSEPHSWRHQLWLSVVNNTDVTRMQYNTQLVLPGKSTLEVTEIVVNHTGYEDNVFTANMPFSWLLFRIVEDTVKTAIDTAEDSHGILQRVTDVIENSTIGKVLQAIVEQNIQEIPNAYLSDFVHMAYPVRSSPEHQLVCESIYNTTTKLLQSAHVDGLTMIAGFHLVFRWMSRRLHIYSRLNRVWPNCSKTIIKFKNDDQNFLKYDEMTLDVLGLHLLMKTLEPELDALSTHGDEWLHKFHMYRPVVERILDISSTAEDVYYEGIEDARSRWTNVVLIKLFMEHVCSIGGKEKDENSVTPAMSLWAMMKHKGASMKKKCSLEIVEQVLKICNEKALCKIFNLNNRRKCRHCESKFEGAPVMLPCGDTICTKCFKEHAMLNDLCCPVCNEKLPENFDCKTDNTAAHANLKKYKDYKTRCDSFFMEVVSQLCFAYGTAPEDEVVVKLLKYITRETQHKNIVTKEMSIFEDNFDPTPILRSYLLQLLLRTSGDKVYQHLNLYFQKVHQFVGSDKVFMWELCLMIIQCVEDSYHYEVTQSDNEEETELHLARKLIDRSQNAVKEPMKIDIKTLYRLAGTRFSLTVVAKYVHQLYVNESRECDSQIRNLLEFSAQKCQAIESKWPSLFFVKQLCRCYEVESYEKMINCKNQTICKWIRGLNLQRKERVECTDNYVVCEPLYTQLRERLTKSLLGDNILCLEEKVKDTNYQEWNIRTLLLLAVHREITMLNVYSEDKRPATSNMLEKVKDFFTKQPLFKGQDNLIRALFENTLWKRYKVLNIGQGMGFKQQALCCLFVHAFITFLQLPGDKTLLQPFILMAKQPDSLARSFLPTMPQTELEEIREALKKASGDNATFYRCPNGHLYVIGNCGNPSVVAACKVCGSAIGGSGHVLKEGNTKNPEQGELQPGHIIGRADKRAVAAENERNMTPVACAITRLLTHISMIIGADTNPQEIRFMIKPEVGVDDIYDFLMSHIHRDMDIIQKVTGYSFDDTVLILHSLLMTFLTKHNQGESLQSSLYLLTTTENRKTWENMFGTRYITPLMQGASGNLKAYNKLVAEDQRLGSDPLLCLLYETDSSQSDDVDLHNIPAVWRFHKRISVDHMATEFSNQVRDANKVLQLFLEEEHHLRALRLVPSIMRLQKMLKQKYHRKLDRMEANSSFSLREVITDFRNDGKEDVIEQLIKDFSEAWVCVRNSLATFPCPTMDGFVTLSVDDCNQNITMNTNVAMLLPYQRGAGLCSYSMLYFLLKQQNSFLDKYCTAKKQRSTDLPRVKVADITPAHLISYHHDRDILSIVLANCNYSFQVGQGTNIEYNFDNIERQLIDRFLFSKSFIDVDEIELMTYRSDVTNTEVFAILREKIPQVQLSAALRREICDDFKSYLPDICECLDQLDIAISFLKSVGEKSNCSLENFMKNTLKMKDPLISLKSRQMCECRHIQSLWLTLAMEKTKCLANYNRDGFDGIKPDFHTDITNSQKDKLKGECDELQIDKVYIILELLFECIMLRMSASQNPEDEDYVDLKNTSLRDFLFAYSDSRFFDEEIETADWMMHVFGNLPADPDDDSRILVSHAVCVWLYFYESYLKKEKESRR